MPRALPVSYASPDEFQRRVAETVNEAIRYLVPTGVIVPFGSTTVPFGWLLCDGSAVSRTTYAGLFAVIGTTFGAGDGSTTFNLPSLTGRYVKGGSPGTSAGSNTTTIGLSNLPAQRFVLAANGARASTSLPGGGGNATQAVSIDDITASTEGGGAAMTTEPAHVTAYYIIRT